MVAIFGEVEAGESFSAGVGDEKLAVLPGIVKHNSTPTRQKEKQESFTNNSKKSWVNSSNPCVLKKKDGYQFRDKYTSI